MKIHQMINSRVIQIETIENLERGRTDIIKLYITDHIALHCNIMNLKFSLTEYAHLHYHSSFHAYIV